MSTTFNLHTISVQVDTQLAQKLAKKYQKKQ